MKKIVIILGSERYLPQCAEGLDWLYAPEAQGETQVTIHIRSVHRHTRELHHLLRSLADQVEEQLIKVVIIAGAGMAAHLPGCVDAYLRYTLGDGQIPVIGVAFWSGKGIITRLINALAARLSITQVPGTRVTYAGLGGRGFSRACRLALNEFPPIKLRLPPPCRDLSSDQALSLARTV